MMSRAAIAFLALALPAFAQHGGAHSGSFGGRGFSGHAGFSSHAAFSGSGSFARLASTARYGAYTGTAYRTYAQPVIRSPYYGNRFAAVRPSYGSRVDAAPRVLDRFDVRRRQFRNWYAYTYPYWAGYPYLLNPNAYNLGLYDWGDSDDTAFENSQPGSYEPDQSPGGYPSDDQNVPAPLYPPYPNRAYYAPAGQSAAAPATSGMPLTVIFKEGRAPIQVRNYLMTAKVLTDLDSEHYEQIPLDQIDLAATRRFNTFAGVDFQVPGA
jgi:hypothetical protein